MQKTIFLRKCTNILILITICMLLYINKSYFLRIFPVMVPYTMYLSTSTTMQNATTVVISYFPLMKAKHSKVKYLSWLENLLVSCQSPMIIYTTSTYQPILYRLRLNGMLMTHFITDYESPLQMPPIKKLVPTFEQQLAIDPERSHHSVALYGVWCAKTFMLNQSVELNPFRTTYFLYIDGGAFRSPKYRFQSWPYDPNLHFAMKNDRLLLSMISRLPQQFCPLSYKLSMGPIKLNLIQGGIIGGSAHAIHWWTSIFYSTIDNYRSRMFFIGKDQQSMNAIALAYPERIHIMLSFRASCDNNWFAFGPLLASQEVRQQKSFSSTCQNQNLSKVIIPLEHICNDRSNIRN